MRKTILLSWLIFLATTAVAQDRKLGLYAIGFYNIENLFDTEHDLDPNTGEDKNDYEYLPDGTNHWTQMKYEHKLSNMARALADMGTDRLKGVGCALIGVSEVENAHCLSDLCAQQPLADRGMKFVHIEGPDKRGVDCGLLYNPRFFQPAKMWLQPYILNEHITRPTRGFLTVQGTLGGDSITVIVCHWPSRFSPSPAREAAGTMVCAEKDSILKANPAMKVLVMGDMNDDPFDASMAKCLKARRKIEDATEGQMYNPFWQILLDGHGTLSYQGGWNLFDQIVMTPNCLDVKGKKDYDSLTFFEAKIQRFPYLLQSEGKYKGTPKRTHAAGVWLDGYSDHLPVVTYFVKRR
ncbi:MAG: endonuclease/exonuclease/phosphatase family protein [Bacteroidaceae bacterium]|nr:endonuclease/exonuclease/phosphatase family protein [Bacteroidaceae bacterium]